MTGDPATMDRRVRFASIAIFAAIGAAVATACSSTALQSPSAHPSVAMPLRARPLIVMSGSAVTGAGPLAGGYGPSDLRSAYKLPSATRGAHETVAIVNAYGDPDAASDLALYRKHYGITACTIENQCLTIVNQRGEPKPLPTPNAQWSVNASVGLDMISAVCPKCRILLVEADDDSAADLGHSVDTAAGLNAPVIATGYAMDEAGSKPYEKYYDHPGHMIVAAIGDAGLGDEFPGSSPDVTAVGGTTLTRAKNARGWTENTFTGSQPLCSAVYAAPPWQKDTGCGMRASGDVGAVADPTTGVAIAYQGSFVEIGGTSVSSPIVAGVYGLAGNAAQLTFGSYSYRHPSHLFTVGETIGAIRRDGDGFHGSTGNGSPDGVGAF